MVSVRGAMDKINKLYTNRRFNVIAFILICVMTFIAYSNTFNSSFHFDDNPSIVDNPYIKRLTLDNLKVLILGQRPVVSLSLFLNYQLGGLQVAGYHLFNISVHAINSYFVYLLILLTLNRPMFRDKYGERAKRMALFAALLFAVHPIQTESVTYIISRSELLATFFYLATFFLFIKGIEEKRFVFFLGAFMTSLLSMGSKQWAVTLPAMLLLYDFLFLSDGRLKTVLSHWEGYLLVALPWGYIAYSTDLASPTNTSFGFNVVTTSGITPWSYLLTSFNVIWTYVRLLILPINQNLDYEYPVAKTLFEFPTLLSFAGHAVVAGAAFWFYKKKGWLLAPFGVAWFYITLSPTQSFVPIIDVIFEHRVYMSSIGFFIVFVMAYEGLFDWLDKKRTVRAG